MSFFKGWEDFRLHALSEVIGLVLSISRRLRPAHLGEDAAAASCRIDNRHDTVLPWDPARSERAGGGGNKRSNPLLSDHLAPLRPAFLFFRSRMMESREGSTADSLLLARFWGSCHSASLMATQEELFQFLFRGEKEGKEKSGFLATKAGKLSESQSLVALLSHMNQIRASKWKEKRLFFQTHSTNVDGIWWGNEPLKINNNSNKTLESGGLISRRNYHLISMQNLHGSLMCFSSLPAASLFFPATWS